MAFPDFEETLCRHGSSPLVREALSTVQVNLTARCNQACRHCHVGASPSRTESMDQRTAWRVLDLLAASPGIEVLDLTGGAPELNPFFRELVTGARALGRRVIDRCNLTILLEPGQEDTASFLAGAGAEIVASLPCYGRENVDQQRGRDVFDRSMEALQRLNRLGYGRPGSALILNLVYNPQGPTLPPAQVGLEQDYRRELGERFGIEFHRLCTLTNMPIRRFAEQLRRQGAYQGYLSLLVEHFNPASLPHLMCRSMISVGHDGRLNDCDFNQMLGMGMLGSRKTIWDLERLDELEGASIGTGAHCFGCTAGAGSSCGGSLV